MFYYGGIEAGGTKFAVAIGSSDGKILKKEIFPTTTPEKTMVQVIEFLKKEHEKTPLKAIGIASFGPVDVNPHSDTYGYITTTPKPGWNNFDIVGSIKSSLKLRVGFDTDVNGAALGENVWGSAKNLDTFIYMTIGTGIGVGGMSENHLMHGLIHPEMGHILIPQLKEDSYEGICPFHKNCLEGLASGPSMMKRWNIKSALDLPNDHIGWEFEAYYLGVAIANYILCVSPQIIILGGGVMKKSDLISNIRKKVQDCLKGYIKHPMITEDIDQYIVSPKLKDNAGVLGSIALAELAHLKE